MLSRLNLLYNRSKHVESAIAHAGQLPENGTLPVWLENTGLRSTDAHLTFAEIADSLRLLSRFAKMLEDPQTTQEKIEALAAEAEESGP